MNNDPRIIVPIKSLGSGMRVPGAVGVHENKVVHYFTTTVLSPGVSASCRAIFTTNRVFAAFTARSWLFIRPKQSCPT